MAAFMNAECVRWQTSCVDLLGTHSDPRIFLALLLWEHSSSILSIFSSPLTEKSPRSQYSKLSHGALIIDGGKHSFEWLPPLLGLRGHEQWALGSARHYHGRYRTSHSQLVSYRSSLLAIESSFFFFFETEEWFAIESFNLCQSNFCRNKLVSYCCQFASNRQHLNESRWCD